MGTPVLLAIAHGSREPAAAALLDRLMDRVRGLAPDLDARLSYVDHVMPSVGQALDDLGFWSADVVAVPLLLSAASHSKGDIPGSIMAARGRHRGLSVRYGRVLGPHPLLLRALAQRLAEAAVPESAAVVLAAAGAADPEANADVARTARLLWEFRGGGPVEAGFAAATEPGVAAVVDRFRRLGYDDIAVASYFLAPGRFAATPATLGVPVTQPLADTDAVAELVLERYAEAVAGRAVMNCDCCIYRTPWPGREHRVGQPQRPHAHPGERAI